MSDFVPIDDACGSERALVVQAPAALVANPPGGHLATEVKSVRRSHRKCLGAGQRSVGHALEAGKSLLRSKAFVPHGEWCQWVRKTFRGQPSLRMAQNYMRLAEGWEVLSAKTNSSSFLSLQEALRLLGKNEPEGPSLEQLGNPSTNGQAPPTLSTLVEAVLSNLDPAAGALREGAALVPARHAFTTDRGLEEEWRGRVLLQPPSGRELSKWIAKLRGEFPTRVEEALVLVPARTNTQAFLDLAQIASCLAFFKANFGDGPSPAPPTLVAYLGNRVATFVEAFEEHAVLLFPRP